MGRCSDVFLLTGPQAEMEFNRLLGTHPDPVTNDQIVEFVHSAQLFPKDGWTLRMWDGVKWYDEPGVDFVLEFIEATNLKNDEEGAVPDGYRFVRVGEDLCEEGADFFIEEVLNDTPPDDLYVVVRMVAKTLGGPNERFLGLHARLKE